MYLHTQKFVHSGAADDGTIGVLAEIFITGIGIIFLCFAGSGVVLALLVEIGLLEEATPQLLGSTRGLALPGLILAYVLGRSAIGGVGMLIVLLSCSWIIALVGFFMNLDRILLLFGFGAGG